MSASAWFGDVSDKRLNHETPFWITENSDYFITINAEPRGRNHFCNDTIGPAVLEFAHYYNDQQRWFCSIALLMPDHLHMIICFRGMRIWDLSWGTGSGAWLEPRAFHGSATFSIIGCAMMRMSKINLNIFFRIQCVQDWLRISKSGRITGCRKLTVFFNRRCNNARAAVSAVLDEVTIKKPRL